MKWSWSIGTIAGVRLRVHVTFPLLFVLTVLSGVRSGATANTIIGTVGLVATVFVIVVLHEFGHALVARRFGIRTHDILLLPIGGMARLERMPRNPRQELLIAVAGPAVNVVFAACLIAVLAAFGHTDAIGATSSDQTRVTVWTVLAQLFIINLSLAAFNLLPAFPMDGGRALRALMAIRSRDYAKATRSAARVGRICALVFGLAATLGLGSPLLFIIAVFVWVAAGSEAMMVQTSATLEHVALSRLLITDVDTLAPNDLLSRPVRLTLEGFQQDFPVVDDDVLVGILTRRDLVRGLAEGGANRTVGSAMQHDYPTVTLDAPVEDALHRLAGLGAGALPVVQGQNKLVGLLTMENVSEFLTLKAADPASVASS